MSKRKFSFGVTYVNEVGDTGYELFNDEKEAYSFMTSKLGEGLYAVMWKRGKGPNIFYGQKNDKRDLNNYLQLPYYHQGGS